MTHAQTSETSESINTRRWLGQQFADGHIHATVVLTGTDPQGDDGEVTVDSVYCNLLHAVSKVIPALNTLIRDKDAESVEESNKVTTSKNVHVGTTTVLVEVTISVKRNLSVGYLIAAADLMFEAATQATVVVIEDSQNQEDTSNPLNDLFGKLGLPDEIITILGGPIGGYRSRLA